VQLQELVVVVVETILQQQPQQEEAVAGGQAGLVVQQAVEMELQIPEAAAAVELMVLEPHLEAVDLGL
jgi:hypothetical protein